METIIDMMKHIVVFLLIASLLGNLFAGSEYRRYLSFTTGLIVMIMVLVPIFSLFGKDWDLKNQWRKAEYHLGLEENVKEVSLLGSDYEKEVLQKYEETVTNDIMKLCDNRAKKCNVIIKDGVIESIHIKMKQTISSQTTLIESLSFRYGIDKNNIFIEEDK